MNPNKFLTTEERNTLDSFLKSRIKTNPRDAVLLLVALHTGARASEILGLLWEDVNTKTGELYIRTLKRGNPRSHLLPTFLLAPIERLRKVSPKKPFDLSYSRLGEIWRLYRPVKKPFHCLRHSWAMWAMTKTNGNVHFVQRALGHKSINNTMVYLDFMYSAKEFKKILNIR